MPTASFDMNKVWKLLEDGESRVAEHGLRSTIDDLFDGELYPGGEPLDEDGNTEAQVEAAGGVFWPSAERIDQSKVEFKLQLVGDHGLYLIHTAKYPEGETPSSTDEVVYAVGCDPKKDEDFYDNKCRIFGDDDGSINIPTQWVEAARKAHKRRFSITLSASSIKLNL